MYKFLNRDLKKGFTLLEILIVMVIIAVLATLAIPQYRKLVARGRATEAVQTIGDIKSSVMRYYAQYDDIVNADDIDTIESTYDIDIPDDAKFTYSLTGNDPSDLAITSTPNPGETVLSNYITNITYDAAGASKDININWSG